MKTFAIFPSISVFLIVMGFLYAAGLIKTAKSICISIFLTFTLCSLIFYYSLELFNILYQSHFYLVLILIPSLVVSLNKLLPKANSKYFYLRMIGIILIAILITLLLFGASFFCAMLNNAMDPPCK